jgi:hypothetical protein
MSVRSFVASAALGSVLAAAPVFAHHSFSMEFDSSQPIQLTGVITRVDWRSPHSYFYMDVKDENGKLVNWTFEAAGPAGLSRNGWSRDSIRVGDHVTVSGYRARSAAQIASARAVTLLDGRRLSAGSAYDGGPHAN